MNRTIALSAFLTAWVGSASTATAEPMAFCWGPIRKTCVVDGDTFWFQGEKVRIADIDAPESGGACEFERMLAARASGRLTRLRGDGEFTIERQGKDRFGRTLAVVTRDGRSLGLMMVDEGLARKWTGHREDWCERNSAFATAQNDAK